METVNWQEFYPFLFGIGLIIATMLAFGLGRRSGRRQERVWMARQHWKKKQAAISLHRKEQQGYVEKIRTLEEELERLGQESESYQEKLADIARYRQKILICEQQIRQLSSEGAESAALSLLYRLKDDPVHVNLSRQDWDMLIDLTDVLFNQIVSSLTEKYGLTRHEQEISCLVKWNFTRKEQLAIFNNTSDALTKSKQRMKKRLQLDEKNDLDSFIRLF